MRGVENSVRPSLNMKQLHYFFGRGTALAHNLAKPTIELQRYDSAAELITFQSLASTGCFIFMAC